MPHHGQIPVRTSPSVTCPPTAESCVNQNGTDASTEFFVTLHLIDMRKNIVVYLVSLAALAAATASRAAGQEPAGLETAGLVLPADVLRKIAIDFDRGRNPFYCYFGTRSASTPDRVRVDSVTTVAAPTDCAGNGLGFIARVDDRFFLTNALKGLIDAMPKFLVVSAFYRTEDIEHDGHTIHTAHALSIIRGMLSAASTGRL